MAADTATNAAFLGLASGDVISGGSDFPASFSGSTGHMGTGPQQWDNGETAYIVLSLVAKSALAWQIFANTLID